MSASSRGRSKPGQDEFVKIIRSLNEEYGLDLRGPDVTLSPSKNRIQLSTEDLRESRELYDRLRVLHFAGRLPRRLGHFKSKAQSRDWVDKRHADPDTLPDISAPLGARSGRERAELRRCLRDVLDESRQASKRLSDEDHDGPSRRTRSRLSGDGSDYNPIDSLPFRPQQLQTRPERIIHERLSTVQQAHNPSFIHASVTSSRVSYPSTVFSVTDVPESGLQSSQDTNPRLSQDYQPCSAEVEALKESFSKFDDSKGPIEPRKEAEDTVGAFLQPCNGFPDEADTECGTDARLLSALGLDKRFDNIWPTFPIPGLNEAPLAVIWEVTRMASHCKVDLRFFDLAYNPSETWWRNQREFRSALSKHRLFAGKEMPALSNAQAWAAALDGFRGSNNRVVVLSIDLVQVNEPDEHVPIFEVKLQPLSLRLGHRLDRRFGADRCLEVTMPQLDPRKNEEVVKWLCHGVHYFLGRTWTPFFVSQTKKKVKEGPISSRKSRDVHQHQVYFFATDGNHFRQGALPLPPPEEARNPQYRTKLSYSGLLEWAVNLRKSAKQPVPKLFSRMKLSLSRTHPTVVLEKHEIYHRRSDILSTPNAQGTRQVMNDGVGRMSRSLAKEIAAQLNLTDIPSAFQGRLGSAKGMWIVDDINELDGNWIETYPSQRKWECGFDDPHHRTLEVREWSTELKPAYLNMQFIPILEAQSRDPSGMRRAIAQHLEQYLRSELDTQAIHHPAELRGWLQQTGMMSKDRGNDYEVPYVGGLPGEDADKMALLLDSGFDATNNRFLNTLLWNAGGKKAKSLTDKWKIRVPCSTYAFMVADFAGILEPDEVHLSFSSKYQVEGFSDTLLEGMDVLVGRAPGHFPSDIQRVRVVSKPELRRLKDVVVFPTKGERALADLLSGGDYDGDKAWVCWDQSIVRSFVNAAPPPEYDFVQEGFLSKTNEKFQSLWDRHRSINAACAEFQYMGISFNLQPSLLGRCTKYKEKLCYHRDPVDSEQAVVLSALLSTLVDQAKSGITFTEEQWKRFRRERLRRPMVFGEMEYEKEKGSSDLNRKSRQHVLDYLKFFVAQVVVDRALTEFHNQLKALGANEFDSHLVMPYEEFDERVKLSTSGKSLRKYLNHEIQNLEKEWRAMSARGSSFQEAVRLLYQRWVDISPPQHLRTSETISQLNETWSHRYDPARPWMSDDWSAQSSPWSLLKASATFKLFHREQYNFLWYMAGRQLATIKAKMESNLPALADTSAVTVVPRMYAILRPDKKMTKALAERRRLGVDGDSVAALEEVMDFDDDGTVIDDA